MVSKTSGAITRNMAAVRSARNRPAHSRTRTRHVSSLRTRTVTLPDAGSYLLGRPLAPATKLSAVYHGTHRFTGKPAALKLVPNATPLLQREAEMLSHLDHPNVVRGLEHGIARNGQWFLATELLPGKNLQHIIGQHGPCGWQAAYNISLQLCFALEAVHNTGIVHRDLKLGNAMLHFRRPVPHVTLFDFGIATYMQGPHLEDPNRLVGTASYMAPEIWALREYSAQSDLYALGVVMYALLNGKTPFRSTELRDYSQMHMYLDPPKMRRAKHIPGSMQQLVFDLLAKSPVDRPESARAVIQRLFGISANYSI